MGSKLAPSTTERVKNELAKNYRPRRRCFVGVHAQLRGAAVFGQVLKKYLCSSFGESAVCDTSATYSKESK
jgi:hypothetical protein